MSYYASDANSLWNRVQDRAANIARASGLTRWDDTRRRLRQETDDLNNYMSSGNWTTDNTANFRSSALKSVEDLTNEMNRYGSSTDEYKQLKNYKTYYENALGQFDRMDVVSNTQDYIGQWKDNGFDNWHTEEEYNTQRSYLDDQRNSLQSQIDEIEKKMKDKGEYYNADLETLKSYRDMYDQLSEGLDYRNEWDRQYPTLEDYTSYQKSQDYNYSSQLEATLAEKYNELTEKYNLLSALEAKFGAPSQNIGNILANAYAAASGAGGPSPLAMVQDPEGYQQMLDLKDEVKTLRDDYEAAAKDLERVQYYQNQTIASNIGRYDPNTDWQAEVDRLKEARRKAEESGDQTAYAKIDRQIKWLAGANEDGTDANGLYDDESYLGQWHLQNIDVEKDKAAYDELERQLDERGAGTTNSDSWWRKLGAAAADAQNAQAGVQNATPMSVSTYQIENDPEIIKMRSDKQDLWRNLQSAEKYQNRVAMADSYNKLGEANQQALIEAGKAAVAEDGKTYMNAKGVNAALKNFEYLDETMDADLRDMIYAAIGAELTGANIGYTVDDVLTAYEKRMAQTAGAARAKKDNEIENDFARWNKQVLGVGTIAGLNQFATGVKQAFTEDMVEPNRAAYRGQYTREYLKQYGDEVLFGNSAVGGSNVSQLLFDTTQTTANMLPMIAASYVATKLGAPEVVAELLGAGLMSVSSAGNSYQQALSEGWEKDDAKTFAVITGAAEGGLQYLLGGISQLGGKGAEPLLQLAERINDAGVRIATKTALHIASETAEELIQNRIERYLRYKFNGEDPDYMSWNEDDWYTVMVTALSTGLLEGPGEIIGNARAAKLGNQLSGNTIPSKGWTEKQKQWNAAVKEVGSVMQGDPALKASLTSFATNPELVEEGGLANTLATRMKDGKLEASATNLGRLYSAILEEYQGKDAPGVQAAMAGVIGGAIQYHKNQAYQSELDASNKQVAEIKAANPNTEVLGLNESELMKFPGVTLETAKAYSPILNKIMSGTNITAAEMNKILDGSSGGEAALNLLRRMAEYKETDVLLRLDKASAEEGVKQMVQQFQRRKAERKAAAEAAVAQAQVDATNGVRIAESAEGANQHPSTFYAPQEQVEPEVVNNLREAEAKAQEALKKIEKIKSMSIKELGTTKLFEDLSEENAGAVDAAINADIYDDLQKQLQDLQKRADKLSAIKFPSRQQSIELADIRQQQAAIQQRVDTMMDELAERVIAKTRGESPAEASAQTGTVQSVAPASNAPADVVSFNGANVTREEFLASRKAAIESGERTVEDVNAEFDAMLAGTGNVKENVNGRDQSSNPAEERNDVGNAADRGEDRQPADQSRRADDSRNGAGGIELFAGNRSSGGRVYASDGATVTSSDDEASLRESHPELDGLGQYLLDSGFTSVRYVTNGQLLVESVDPETGERVAEPVAAIVRGTEVVLNPDFRFKAGNNIRRTAEHERTHLRLRLLRQALGENGRAEVRSYVSSTLQNLLGKEAYRSAFMKYFAEYAPIYSQNESYSVADLGHMVNEEMFCDMVAGLNCWDTGLGKYEKDIAGMLEESHFDAVVDMFVDGEGVGPGLTYEETEAMPYGYEMKETIDITDPFRNDVDRTKPPEARPLPGEDAMHEEQQLMSKQSMAEATGFELLENDEGFPYALKNQRTGEIVNKVTPHMMVDTPVGKLVTTAKNNGFISNYAANREYVMLSQVMNLILENKDAALTWELVGSQLFSGLKKNSDTQYNWTVDFGTICRKTQALITAMSETMKKVGHGLSRREIEEVYLQTGLAGEATPCPVCYVFSRWMGIGGLLDDINTFQNTYFTIDQNTGAFTWADGKSEADLAAFMSGIEQRVIAWAKEKQKDDFFQDENAENKFVRSNLNFGKILSDMKSSPNRILAEAVKKINNSRQAVLIIQELESSAKKATGEKAQKLNNAIAKMRGYLLTEDQIKEQEAKISQAEAALAEFDRYQWAARAVMRQEATDRFENGERVYEWKLRNDYKPVPQKVLFDLDKGEEFAKNYASTWAFRTGKGNAMGKAIMPYSDARVGETIQGVATKNTKVLNQEMIDKMDVDPEDKKAVAAAMKAASAGIKSGAALNPFVKETALQKSYAEAKQSGDKKAIRAAEKALKANWKEQGDFMDRAMNAIRKQNLIGGMRMQSTSDFRFEWGSDYLITFFELQAIGANVQLYTKVIEAVDFLASTGADCNLSVMPRGLGYSNGELEFSDVTGINAKEAIKKAKQYDNVQLILVGISDENIRLALAGTDVTFVIPFHGSGQSVDQVQTLVNLLGEDLDVELAQDYSDVQDDHIDPRLSKEEAAKAKAMRALRMDIIRGKFWKEGTKKQAGHNITPNDEQQALLRENPHLARLFDMFYNEKPTVDENGNPLFTRCMVDENGKSIAYHCFLGKEQAEKIFPYEYWDTSLRYAEADQNGENFKAYCKSLGIIPRFSGINAKGETVDHGNFTDLPGYWKLLIDRKMYKNEYDANGNWIGYGEFRNQQRINVSDVKVGMLNESTVRKNISKDAWTKDIHPDRTAKIVEKSAARIEEMREQGDIYDTKKISKEFRADRLAAKKDMREAEQQMSLQEEDTTPVAQTYTSKDTSINSSKLPVVFTKPSVKFVKGGTNIDIGGGRFDNATEFLKNEHQVKNSIFDPFNRDRENNREIVESLQNGKRFDTATISNVLNVIDRPEARANVILEAAKAIKPDGAAYFTVYEGDAKGGAAATTKGWQENRRLASYKDEISQFFNDVQIRNGVITARDPKTNLPQAAWEIEPGEAMRFSLQPGEEISAKVKDGTILETGERVDFIEKLLDGSKWGETRPGKSFVHNKWVGLEKDGLVYGRVKFGKPYEITRENPEYAHTFIQGTEYDIPEGGSKYYYPVEAKEVFDKPVPNTKVGQYGKYTIPSKADLTERRAQEYNENTQQRFSKQESENNGGRENDDARRKLAVADQLNKLLQEENWTRSYLEAARRPGSGIEPKTVWRSDERRQQRVINFVTDFLEYHKFSGERIDQLDKPGTTTGEKMFEYGTVDFLDWLFDTAATDPAELRQALADHLEHAEYFLKGLNKAMVEPRDPELNRRTFDVKDQEYLEAIENNDIEKLRKMVDEAARAKGYMTAFFQHSPIYFDMFSRGEFGFHLGSFTQAAHIIRNKTTGRWNYNAYSESPHYFLNLYSNIKNPYTLPQITEWDGTKKNDYNNWTSSFIAEQLLSDTEEFSDPLEREILTKISEGNAKDDFDSPERKAVTDILEAHGFDALNYTNSVEGDKSRDSGEAFILWDPSRLKSADLITYDRNGKIIPLSDRFDDEDNWFRYSKQEEEIPVSNPFQPNTFEYDLMDAILKKGDKGAAEWATKQLQKNNQKMENAKIIPPRVPTRSFVPMPTKEEMAVIEKERLDRIGKWGALKKSAKTDSDWVSPKKNNRGENQARFAQNAATTNVFNEPAKDLTKRFAFTAPEAVYVEESNKAALERAKNKIKNNGLDYSVKSFVEQAEEATWHYAGENSLTNVLALGQQLLVETQQNGTYRDFLDVLSSLTLLATQAGKSLQAFTMLHKTGPIGELYYVQKTVNQMNNKKYAKLIESGKMKPITINDKLSKAVILAATEEERTKAMDVLVASIAEQVPVTFMDKWNAWRHFAMLGNARTHIRNLFGNGIFVPLRFAKDLMATAGESIAVKTGFLGMQETDRTKSFTISQELRDFAKQDAKVMRKELQGNGKYNPAQDILDARQIFKVKALDKASKWNGEKLEEEDWWFLAPAYQKALGMALSHTGFSIKELQTTKEGQKALNNARRIAIEEAQRATYRDFSVAAAALNRLKKGGGAAGILLEGVLPFTKTPINILRRGVEYSPVGIITALTGLAKDYRTGSIDAARFIDRMSAGLSGTAVAILGYLLAKIGWLRGKKDDKEEDFDKLQGHQDYSLEIGGVSATIDWAAPTALPLFTGAAAYDLMEGGEKLSISTMWDAMMLIAEPMMSLSMLDGLNRTLSAASYAGENEKVASILTSAATSYFGQGVPTLLGQLARSMDGTRRQTYVDKNSRVPAGMQRFIQTSLQNKVPAWEEQKAPYIDQWGREDTTSSKALGTLENFLSPSYWSMVRTTDVDAALQELYGSTKESSILPSSPTKKIGDRQLTAEEYTSYAKDVGATKYDLLTQLIHDPRYETLTDEQKIKAVKKIYEYASAAGKYHLDPSYSIRKNGAVWMEEAEAMTTPELRYRRIWEAIEAGFKD